LATTPEFKNSLMLKINLGEAQRRYDHLLINNPLSKERFEFESNSIRTESDVIVTQSC